MQHSNVSFAEAGNKVKSKIK